MTVKRKVAREIELSAWYGTKADVLAMVEMTVDSFRDEMQRSAAKLPKPSPRSSYERNEFAAAWRAQLVITTKHGDEVTGEPTEALDAVLPRQIKKIAFRYPRGYDDSTRVVATWGSWLAGLRIAIEGSDAVRAHGLMSALRERALECRPTWARLTSTLPGLLLLGTIAYAIWTATILGISNHYAPKSHPLWPELVAAVFGQLPVMLIFMNSRLAPTFELLADGARPRAFSILATAGTLLAGTALATIAAVAFL